MVRTAADRWKRVKRAPLDLLKAAAAQPFDDNSLLGQAAVFRAKRAKRHKPAPAPKKELTAKQIALQRRRKTKNKGAQHHQKDRAARKV